MKFGIFALALALGPGARPALAQPGLQTPGNSTLSATTAQVRQQVEAEYQAQQAAGK